MTVLVSILLTGAIILASNVLGELTEKLSGFGADGAGRLLILAAGAFLLQELLDAVYQLLKSQIECYTFGNIQKKLLHQILYLSPDHPEMKNSSGLYTLMVRHAGGYTGFLSDTVPNIIFQTIRLVLVLVYIALVDWRSTVVYVAAILVSMTIQFFISRIMEKASSLYKSKYPHGAAHAAGEHDRAAVRHFTDTLSMSRRTLADTGGAGRNRRIYGHLLSLPEYSAGSASLYGSVDRGGESQTFRKVADGFLRGAGPDGGFPRRRGFRGCCDRAGVVPVSGK